MSKISRRSLAKWSAKQLAEGKSAAYISGHLAATLVEAGMAEQVDFLLNDILWELEQDKVLVVGKVTSVHQITRQLEESLAQQIKKATGAGSVLIEKSVDKSVLGGVRIETSNHIWDSTVLRKLSELKEVF
jgi:F0F1-type ATP synthase delta subunit